MMSRRREAAEPQTIERALKIEARKYHYLIFLRQSLAKMEHEKPVVF